MPLTGCRGRVRIDRLMVSPRFRKPRSERRLLPDSQLRLDLRQSAAHLHQLAYHQIEIGIEPGLQVVHFREQHRESEDEDQPVEQNGDANRQIQIGCSSFRAFSLAPPGRGGLPGDLAAPLAGQSFRAGDSADEAAHASNPRKPLFRELIGSGAASACGFLLAMPTAYPKRFKKASDERTLHGEPAAGRSEDLGRLGTVALISQELPSTPKVRPYLTTDRPFGDWSERTVRGLVRKVQTRGLWG